MPLDDQGASANRFYPHHNISAMPSSRASISTSATGQSFLFTDADYNRHGFRYSRADRARPYPSARDVYVRSNTDSPGEDSFSDLGLNDLMLVHKRVARRKLERLHLEGYQTGLLLRGVQVRMDRDEPYNGVLESAIGYAGLVGVMVMDEIAVTNERVDKMEGVIEGFEDDVARLTVENTNLSAKVERLEDEARRRRDAMVGLQTVVTTLREETAAIEEDRQHLLRRVRTLEVQALRANEDAARFGQRLHALENWRLTSGRRDPIRLVLIKEPIDVDAMEDEFPEYPSSSSVEVRSESGESLGSEIPDQEQVVDLAGEEWQQAEDARRRGEVTFHAEIERARRDPAPEYVAPPDYDSESD